MPKLPFSHRLLFAAVLLSLFLPTTFLGQTTPEPATGKTYQNLPSEIPANFQPVTSSFDYVRREVMIPMRDGVKLHTVILIPKGANHAPMLLTRTPYNASALTTHEESAHLGPSLEGYDNATDVILEDGYIRVVQDVRGKYGSEGDYVMNRFLSGSPENPTPVDHATDTYDTVDWLVKNVPESNGRVGVLGISYDGFTTLMAAVHPHPALKCVVPMNPMVDGWMGDDWFHNGAFREQNLSYIYEQDGSRKNEIKWWVDHYDEYDMFMQAVSAGELGHERGMEQLGFWKKLIAHPSYDSWWQDQAVDKALAKEPLAVPMMLVHSLWDQEDIYGAQAVYRALQAREGNNDKLFLVMGPWHHGQEIHDGRTLGVLRFDSDTGKFFRQQILRPFLAHYLMDNPPATQLPKVWAFETGENRWEKLSSWPAGCENGCAPKPTPIYLHAASKLSFDQPAANEAAFDEYVSDPAKPVPFIPRPVRAMTGEGTTWSDWLVTDQRGVSGRTDVAVFTTDKLTKPVRIAGAPMVNLIASTSGTDSDWVVKLIDVYPDEVADQPEMGGFQLAVSMDVLRGRYRESFSNPKAITPNTPLLYKFALPNANHVFLPGHRIMVQVQSTWFPLYDRNPQTFVPNIFFAKPENFQKATQRIYHQPDHASFIELPVVAEQ